MPLLSAAIEYAIAGWPVIPVVGKRAIEKDWPNRWTVDPEEAAKKRWDGIGLVTGVLFFVLDIDGEKGFESLTALLGDNELPVTPTAETGKGIHYFFLMPSRKDIRNRTNVLPGIDIRGLNGYVVAPPSPHDSGKTYRWIIDYREAALADAPKWLLRLLRQKPKKKQYAERPSDTSFDLESIPPIYCGQRNDRLYRLACAAFANGKSTDVVEGEISWINKNRCEDAVSEREIDVIVRSASKHRV